ncbi:hypothetical protein OQA88_3716 [Cercophora sp. LCS_1]
MSGITLQDTPLPSPSLITLLTSHLPYSLPVLRRLQSALNLSAYTPTTHILHATIPGSPHFATAYLDLSRSPETECWLYCTIEDSASTIDPHSITLSLPASEVSTCDDLVLAILQRARRLGTDTQNCVVGHGKMVLGSLNEVIRQRLIHRGVGMDKTPAVEDGVEWEFCGKWLFRVEALGGFGLGVGEGTWDGVRRGDLEVVKARTRIPRQKETLLRVPSVVVRVGERPVAWAFLGLDGTLMTLHVEEDYRGRGLAKAVACRLMRDHLGDFGDDGWGAADVLVSNHKSQAVCRSIGGKVAWTCSWAILDLTTVGEAI